MTRQILNIIKRAPIIILGFIMIIMLSSCGNSQLSTVQDEETDSNSLSDISDLENVDSLTDNVNELIEVPTNDNETVENSKTDDAIPESGSMIDKKGFTVTTGEFFEAFETLLTNSHSEFYPGTEVKILPGVASKEIRRVIFAGSEYINMVSTTLQRQDEFPGDDDKFSLIMVMGDGETAENRGLLTILFSVVLYLTCDEISDFSDACDFMSDLIENADTWKQIDAMEYQYTLISDSIIVFAVREIEAYS